MSTTSGSQTMTTSMMTMSSSQDYLRDYSIVLSSGIDETAARQQPQPSQPQQQQQQQSTTPQTPTSSTQQNPPGWETDYRQVPPYRPVNMQLDRASRPWGSNRVESAIIFTMMHGVWLKSTIAWLWRVTGGRANDRAFETKIGGEL
ncbi:hypothetical protein B0T17DRAFT_612245 [Bombardia bombarda]|uniref:Uncharacterized protein n=1 Tax=Bombardia bombarda TaxID=252184 RepID=A0AA39XJV8_9PEZI|nr:hypothetical protein B0T17DRAFT_612245 [Bombardia bombarda]